MNTLRTYITMLSLKKFIKGLKYAEHSESYDAALNRLNYPIKALEEVNRAGLILKRLGKFDEEAKRLTEEKIKYIIHTEHVDAVTYTASFKLDPSTFIKNDGYWICKYNIKRLGDVIDNIEFIGSDNVEISYLLGCWEFTKEELDIYLDICSAKLLVVIKFLEEPGDQDYYLNMRVHLIKQSHLDKLTSGMVYTKHIVYYDSGRAFMTTKNLKDGAEPWGLLEDMEAAAT